MKQTFGLKHVAGAAALAVASMSSHAACTTIGSTGTVDLKIAVASNFSAAAQSIATSFLAVGPKSYKIQICDGSSQALRDDIVNTSNSSQYALFLSADSDRPADLRTNSAALTADDPFTYANGIPVFLLSPNAYSATSGTYRAVNYLSTGQGSGATATRSDSSLSAISNQTKLKKAGSPTVSTLAIAKPSDAPYGLQASRLLGADTAYLNNMGQWGAGDTYVGTATATTCTAASEICSYNNVNTTLTAINNSVVTAGFVSYGQVCPTFTGSTYPLDSYVLYQEYLIAQDGILLNVTDPAAKTKASDFKDYMLVTGAGAADWNTYLTNNCYAPL